MEYRLRPWVSSVGPALVNIFVGFHENGITVRSKEAATLFLLS